VNDGLACFLVTGALALSGLVGWIAGRASIASECRRLRWWADHDALTGLLNRAGFHAAATAVLTAAARHRDSVAAFIVDLEGFKAVNDVHGHRAGDAVLVQVGGSLQRWAAELDGVVGRLGGDEFAVVLPQLGAGDVTTAAASMARLLSRLYRVPAADTDRYVPVGATVGAGWSPRSRPTGLEELLRDADSAMYAARRGRGRTVRAAMSPRLLGRTG
jgi:diguanylate cyclase (GGDEF)-like protein